MKQFHYPDIHKSKLARTKDSVCVGLCVFFCIYNKLKVECNQCITILCSCKFLAVDFEMCFNSMGSMLSRPISEVKSGRKPAVSPLYIA